MWNPFKKEKTKTYPVKDISLQDVRQAIRRYMNNLPDQTPLSVLINDDLTINFHELAPYLEAIPIQTYYMSRETYDIFDENQRHLAEDLDYTQRAVDQYIELTNELPVIHGDPYLKVSYHKLMKRGLITYRPPHEFYIDPKDHLINYTKPK